MNKSDQKILSGAAGLITFVVFTAFTAIAVPVSAILGLGVFAGLASLKLPKGEAEPKKLNTIKITALPEAEDMKVLMNDAYEDLIDIQRGYRAAKHENIKTNAEKLYHTGVSIFEHLRKNPDKIRQARRYMTYYLDTAAGIMNKYRSFIETGLNTEETAKVYEQTNSALVTLNEAFNRQFVRLMQNDLMGIEAEIKVLKQTLEAEEFVFKATQPDEIEKLK
ncbi:MAG: 5-bromo-4-chloroindolyl phosphate hydrolysis family protein [Tissierellia bacterium]|nr:5-bromo-4-chloroindolyl phosphate hydrolysis family protein [Tissierellia bacterium]